MNDWTDTDLEQLLRDTFNAHEDLADPATASRVGADPVQPRRNWVPGAAAAAAVVLTIGTTIVLARDPAGTPTTIPIPDPTATATGPALEPNRVAADQESQRLINAAPVMRGATATDGPDDWRTDPGLVVGDAALARVTWYEFPADPAGVEQFLLSHPPSGMKPLIFNEHASGLAPFTVGDSANGSRYLVYIPRTFAASPVYTGPSLLAEWTRSGSNTLVRFSTALKARQPRPDASRITGDVSSVQVLINWSSTSPDGPRSHSRTIDLSQAQVTELLAAAEQLVGSPEPPEPLSCQAIERRRQYVITVHGASTTTTYQIDAPSCGGQVSTLRDGQRIPGTLDPAPVLQFMYSAIPGPV